jgi:xanthine dehydrogenase small subunit
MEFTVNGAKVSFEGTAPQVTLLDFIRSKNLTAAKEGCAEGECGACAVLLVSQSATGTTYRSVNSCLIPVPAMQGREVITVEGFGGTQDAQRVMAAMGGSQCGYCTPGFIASMVAEQYRQKQGSCDYHALGGNLCRCTGYRPIYDALQTLGPPPEGEMKARLTRPAPSLRGFRYSSGAGRFSRPAHLDECLQLAEDPASRFVAGNTDLGIATNLRGERYPHLISLEGIEELRTFRETADHIEIGSALTLTELSEQWTSAPAFFHDWLALFASLPIRNRATLGGNLATASPIGDSAPLLLALDSEVRLASREGHRLLPLKQFFLGYRQTALAPGELLHSIRIPKPLPDKVRFYKVAKRRMDDISTVSAAIALIGDTLRIGMGGVAATPKILDPSGLDDLKPIGDHRGSAAYRLAMAHGLVDRFRHEVMA